MAIRPTRWYRTPAIASRATLPNPLSASPPLSGRLAGAGSGLLAAVGALAVGELAGGIVSSAGSPIVAVGNQAIDRVPRQVKDLAIDWFGTNDKVALIVGMLVVAALLGAGMGILARRRFAVAIGGFAVFGLLGFLSTRADGNASPPAALVPSLLAALAGMAALWVLLHLAPSIAAREAAVPDDTGDHEGPRVLLANVEGGRRQFLAGVAGVAGVAALSGGLGRVLAGRNSAAASREALVLPKPVNALPPVPENVSVGVKGVTPFVTPNREFYRIDINLAVPNVRAEDHRIKVKGMVDKELDVAFSDILDRDLSEYDITLSCVSNEVGGRLAGHARWLGFPLQELLDEAGVDPQADQVVGRSTDGFTTGFPVQAVTENEAIVAVGMNGEPLPLQHGFPVRLVVPGLYGYLSATKWLEEIELTRFDQFDQYWVKRDWDPEAPVKTFSRIDTPRGLAEVKPGKVAIAGVAWAQARGIDKVEVQIDDEPWKPAELANALNIVSWRQWVYEWDAPDSGLHKITVRATDADGDTQPEERVTPFPNGATGWHSVRVKVDS